MARLDNGFATTIAFADFPTVLFYEKSVTPSGYDGGGAIDTTTMRNTAWRTMAPKRLKTATEIKLTAAYDTDVMDPDEVESMINVNQLMTITFPNGAERDVWGYVNKVDFGELKSDEEQPTINVEIIVTNQDDEGNEVGAVYRPAP